MKIDFFSSIVILIFLSISFDSYGASSSLKTSGSETSDQQNTPDEQKKKTRKISANWDGSACTLPNHSVYLTDENFVYYHSSTPIAGFQFDVEGASLMGAWGGDAEAAEFTTPTGNNTVLGFSLEGNAFSGCCRMVMLELVEKATGISSLIISVSSGLAIDFLVMIN